MNDMNPSVLMCFWAKLGKEIWPEKYHPMICHLIDVGQVARQLWDRVLRGKVRGWVTAKLGLPDDNAAGSWLAFWAATHDIGKLSPSFQSQGKTEELRRRFGESWFDSLGSTKPHGDISTKVLAEELESVDRSWQAVPRKLAQNIAVAVGGHHGIFPTDWDGICGPLGNDHWSAARREMLTELARLFGVTGQRAPFLKSTDDQSVWMFLAGLTSVADWIGSNKTFFPEFGNSERVNEAFESDAYFRWAGCQAVKALHELGWLERVGTATPVTFAELFRTIKQPRPLQTMVAEIVVKLIHLGFVFPKIVDPNPRKCGRRPCSL